MLNWKPCLSEIIVALNLMDGSLGDFSISIVKKISQLKQILIIKNKTKSKIKNKI